MTDTPTPDLTAPERIWATSDWKRIDQGKWWDINPGGDSVEYVRADLCNPTQDEQNITVAEAALVLAKHAREDYTVECDTCEAMGQNLRSWDDLSYPEKSRMVSHKFATALRALERGER